MQLELHFWPPGSLKEAVTTYLHDQARGLAKATLGDYEDRAAWCCLVLGPATSIDDITIQRLHEVVRKWGPDGKGLKQVTLKKRLNFLIASMKYAAARGLIEPMRIPDMKWLKLKDDGRHCETFLTVPQFVDFRAQLGGERYSFPTHGTRGKQSPQAAGRYQLAADIMFWTGHHPHDVQTMVWTHLDVNYVWRDHEDKEISRGRYLRRNNKNKRIEEPTWFPMEPEFRETILAIQTANKNDPDFFGAHAIVGRLSGFKKAFAAAAHKAGVPEVTPNDLRRSFGTMLASRGYPYEYVRLALGHEGEVTVNVEKGHAQVVTKRPTTLTRHYLRPSPELLTNAVLGRKKP